VEPYLNEEGRLRLAGRDKVFAWGNKETLKASFDKMEVGDLVLFYRGKKEKERGGRISYAGTVAHVQLSRELSLALWPPKPGQEPWSCVFFLDGLKSINIPIAEIAEFAGYSSSFFVQGFMPLKEQGMRAILDRFGSVEKFLRHYAEGQAEPDADLDRATAVSAHSEASLLLLKIGQLLGYDTYSPDAGKQAYGEALRDHCTLEQVPTRFLGELVPVIREIDVIWFKNDVPKFAFEVEHTTKVGSGFQRLFQLHPLATKLFIVSSEKNRHFFDKFIETDPYFHHRSSFQFRNYTQLEDFFRAVSEFDAINRTFLAT